MNETSSSESATPRPTTGASESITQPIHRSRWRRFSPSMGWPAFWSEILIVFLGVVIALAANEAVQEWTWRSKVIEAEARLQEDVDPLFLWYAEVLVTQPCIAAHLEALDHRVRASGDVLQPSPIHTSSTGTMFVAPVPTRPYVFGTWDALVADGTATHFSRDRQGILNAIARAADRARERVSESQRLLGRLLVMRKATPLDPGVRISLLTDISQSRLLGESFAASARHQMTRIDQAFGSPDAEGIDEFLFGGPQAQHGLTLSPTVAFCKAQGLPLGDWRHFSNTPRLPASTNPAAEPKS